MQFCDECGSMMRPESGGMKCTNNECEFEMDRDMEREAAFVSTEKQTNTEVIETSEDANFEGKPTAKDVTCRECGHDVAWYTLKQTASADEPPTRFFKCKSCGYRWREYN